MPQNWEAFVNNLKDEAGLLAKSEPKNLISGAKADSDAFVKRQGVKPERYLDQQVLEEITPEEFRGYVEDIRDLARTQELKTKVAAKASAQRLCKGIEELILNGLMRLLSV
jgi:hypothetical protein